MSSSQPRSNEHPRMSTPAYVRHYTHCPSAYSNECMSNDVHYMQSVSGYSAQTPLSERTLPVRTYITKIKPSGTFGPFLIYFDEDELVGHLLALLPTQRTFCATYTLHDTVHLYLDCEVKLEERNPLPDMKAWMEGLFGVVVLVFAFFFPDRPPLDMTEAWVFEACTASKLSFHVHHPRVRFASVKQLELFIKWVRHGMELLGQSRHDSEASSASPFETSSFYVSLTERLSTVPWRDGKRLPVGFPDDTVYKTFGQMRLPLNRKPGKQPLQLYQKPASFVGAPTEAEQIKAGFVVLKTWNVDDLLYLSAKPVKALSTTINAATTKLRNNKRNLEATSSNKRRLDDPDNPVLEALRELILAPVLGADVQLGSDAGCYAEYTAVKRPATNSDKKKGKRTVNVTEKVVWRGHCRARTAICVEHPELQRYHGSNCTVFTITEDDVYIRCLSNKHENGKTACFRMDMRQSWQQLFFGIFDTTDDNDGQRSNDSSADEDDV